MTSKEDCMKNVKLLSAIVTLVLIVLLILAGPARAFIFEFAIDNNFPLLGDIINFKVSAEVEPSEMIDIQTFTLMIEGPQNRACEFYPNATLLSPCNGIQIQNTNIPTFQYGYGFLPGLLEYDITLDSSTLQRGDYTAKLIAHTPTEDFQTSSQNLMIVQLSDPVDRCSIRAEEGLVEINNVEFDARNKLSLFASHGNSRNSKGTFTAQERRERISYKFTVDEARRTTGDVIYFDVHGELRSNREITQESATIIFNTKTLELEIRGDTFNVSGMSVNFARC
jgi:hypothetical protein